MRENPNGQYSKLLADRSEWPIGSELLVAFALGAVGWWGIVRVVMWIAS